MLILDNATLVDLKAGVLNPGASVVIDGAEIVSVESARPGERDARRIDLRGRTLLPGLIDAHFHAMLTDLNLGNLRGVPLTLLTARACQLLRATLDRGFTTVRDMGGADWGLRQAVTEGVLSGPRLFISGRALSQTGGHGDFRLRTDEENLCSCANGLSLVSVVADGRDGVRTSVREQLRQGVDQIKVFLSGGVASPSDPLTSSQYSDEELLAIVAEASAWGTYVAAHAYTAEAISRAARAGVRTIEHGNLIDATAARELANAGGYMVPTLITYEALRRESSRAQLSEFSRKKLAHVLDAGMKSIEIAVSHGIKLGFGTDLLGEFHPYQAEELVLRSRVQGAAAVLDSATRINAEILGQPGRLGVVAPGAIADLIAVAGNPLQNLDLLQHQGRHIDLIVKGGRLHKNRCE